MFSFYSPLHFLRVEIKKELRQVDYISVDVFTSPRGPPDWLRWLANNLPNNYWPRTTKRNIKKILPTQNKKATRAFHFPNSFSVSWIWLASISQSYRENLMRVFLLLLSFFFSFFCLDFVSLLFLFFPSVFSLVCFVYSSLYSRQRFLPGMFNYSFLFSFVSIDVFWYGSRIVEDAHWFAMGNRLSISSSSSSCCFLLLPFFYFLPFQPTKAKEWR